MNVAKCPVCGGNGIVDEGFYRQTSGQWVSAGGVEECRSCKGRGWVSDEENQYCDWDVGTEWISHPVGDIGDDLPVTTTSTEYDASPYWGLSGGRDYTTPHWERQ